MELERINVESRPPNWLPLPGVGVVEEEAPSVEENDLFPKGEVVSFHPLQGSGKIRNACGDLLGFQIDEIELVGPKGHKRYIAEGRRVGYDVSRTSTGAHITKLKVY